MNNVPRPKSVKLYAGVVLSLGECTNAMALFRSF